MARTIRILDDATINQIAAGEVIENPASVVKELIENAVDAGAQKVTVEIQSGGFQEIKIIDDGKGMDKDDLFLCLERHATSKIRSAEDLQTSLAMGFRGEALASIAAVAKIRMTTCQNDRGFGNELYAEGGRIKKIQEAARKKGTTVTVSTLFYNVPARKKFQKSPRSSQSDIIRILTQLALAHPELEIKCLADGREVFSSFFPRSKEKETAMQELIEKVLGKSFLEGATPINDREGKCHIAGYIGAPHQARRNRTGQHLIVNGRYVESPQITQYIYEGYGTRLSSQQHPAFVLHLAIPADWIDVNVHPQKKEIRLNEEMQIGPLIRQGVFRALQGKVSSFSDAPRVTNWYEEAQPAILFREEKSEVKNPVLPFAALPVIGLYDHYLILDGSQLDEAFSIPGQRGPLDGLMLIDLHAAKARLSYEAFLKRFEGEGELQTLLFPLTLEFSQHEKEKVEHYLETFNLLGISIRPFGGSTFVVDAIDPHLDEGKIEALIYELIESLDRSPPQKKLALTAARYARLQKEGYALHEARALVTQLFKAESPFQSPTGKPICMQVSRDEIKKYFC